MNVRVIEKEDGLLLQNIQDFELKHIFDCGQCFRWNEDLDGSFIGVAADKVARLIKTGDELLIEGGNLEDLDFWIEYLDLERDYKKIKKMFIKDPILKEAINYGQGMRILNQEQFEIIISFIISANNNISRIKKTVEAISRKFGKAMEFEDKTFYIFPSPKELSLATVEDLKECGCGYRAEYIVNTTQKIANGHFIVEEVVNMDIEEARTALMQLNGIGPKVADCILLFSMRKTQAFPVDVWVKRVMEYFYTSPDMNLRKIREFGMDKFGEFAGIAQQYLFYYARDKGVGNN
jgi:N-glycosylase/DNA lyase